MQLIMGNWYLAQQTKIPEMAFFDTDLDKGQYDLSTMKSLNDYIDITGFTRGLAGVGLINGVVGQKADKFWLTNFKYADTSSTILYAKSFTVAQTALAFGSSSELVTASYDLSWGRKDILVSRLYTATKRNVSMSLLQYRNSYNAGSYGGYSWNIGYSFNLYTGYSDARWSSYVSNSGSESKPYQTLQLRPNVDMQSTWGRLSYPYNVSYASGTNQILWTSDAISDTLLGCINGQLAAADETVNFNCALLYHPDVGRVFKFDQHDFLVGTNNTATPGTKPTLQFIRKDVIAV
ncbi:hypothetical protein pEaSNUABM5_00197 [Erwinia phage pEa_SNUABM_5]|uniref:Uncharacterized protein n=1 Tax=Erwinia phage pEa_SNUABM_5 TaxID=2797313 RepID=A0A7T8EPK3_9CAUD|nr:hypothetical protein MPK73_gp197 [Erwinia phage pEa_SNUABM_5]QQO90339.1 hypothetical protein pEaSNUABM5_00197 [Erwinia phage pEa_SNUABM_5]